MRRLIALTCCSLLLLAGCGDDDGGTTADGGPSGDDTATATVALTDSGYGEILTTGDGATLYLFTPDTGSESTCTGDCATTWPPLVGPATGDEVDPDDLGTTTRDDGTEQVTFHGHPVYTYLDDAEPGDVNGQGVGGKWFVVDADGTAVTSTEPTATTVAKPGDYGY